MMASCIDPSVTRLTRNTGWINGSDYTIRPKANVRGVTYANSFGEVKSEIFAAVPENLYEATVDDRMKHRHSSPAVTNACEVGRVYPMEQRSESLGRKTQAPKKQSTDAKTRFRLRTSICDSMISSTSLIMASSTTLNTATQYVEKKFLNNSSSMEDLWLRNQEYLFENLVFEGGGSKGMAYVGALQVLEEMDILKNIKRFAGASVGAMVATLAAIGFTSSELQEFLDQDIRKVMVDHSCGYCSLLPNLLKGFGWNPGKKMNHWFGEQLKERTGDYDITFKEVLRLFGKEICIVVTNLNHMSVEYFHPKTTPNAPVRKAVQMSMALPGVFQVVRETLDGQEDVYVDGGLLCNYPIHAYDGWWLSMDPNDTFFKRLNHVEDFTRLHEKSERFGTWNPKTLGIMLYSNTETELMKTLLSARSGNKPPNPPNTKLSKQRLKMKQKQQRIRIEHEHMVHVVGRFIKELERNNLDEDSMINKEEFRAVFENPVNLLPDDLHMLFGENCEVMDAFAQLDRDDDGEITFRELMAFVEKKGVNLQTRSLGYSRREIKNFGDFLRTLQVESVTQVVTRIIGCSPSERNQTAQVENYLIPAEAALAVNVKRVYVEKKDVERTIGIDTDYIESSDFNLDFADKQFLIESGKRSTRAFLYEYISRKNKNGLEDESVSPSGVSVQPEIKTSSEFRPRALSSSSTMDSFKSITTVDID